MKSHLGLITSAVLAATLLAGAPAAQANSLLSGYGGPGQGSQAIIGSGLVNPPGGGGSGGSSSSGGEGSGPGAVSGSSSYGAGVQPGRPSQTPAQRHGGAPARTGTSTPGTGASVAPTGLPASEPAADTSRLGLSGADLVYILLVFGGLMLIGVLTRRMAGRPR